jgi:hypothetical protein
LRLKAISDFLKALFSGAGFVFKPDAEKSQKAHTLIRGIFAKRIKDPGPYTVAYAYLLKRGIFGHNSSSFVVGFSDELKELVVIPVNSDLDEAGDAIRLRKDNITLAKFGLQGEVEIKSAATDRKLRFTVPGYTPAALENVYILPINQETEAESFRRFIKENFS